MRPARGLADWMRRLLRWGLSRLTGPQGTEASPMGTAGTAAALPTAPELGPQEVGERCRVLAAEIHEVCSDLRPPERIDDDLVGTNPRLIWEPIQKDELRWITAERLRSLANAFQQTQRLSLEEAALDGAVLWCDSGFGLPEEAVEALPKVLAKAGALRLVLEISNRLLLGTRLLGSPAPAIALRPILAPADFVQNLSPLGLRPGANWDGLGLDFQRATVLVAVFGQAERIDGKLIQLASPEQVEEALKAVAGAEIALASVENVKKHRPASTSVALPQGLSPLHFELRERAPSSNGERQCERIAAELALAYLGDRFVMGEPTRIEFRGFRTVSVELPSLPLADPLPSGAAASLCRLVEWACDERYRDKSEVMQRLASLQLSDEAGRSFLEILSAAGRLLESARQNWLVILSQATALYFEQQKELSNFLAARVSQYGERLQALLKGLTGYGVTLLGFFLSDYLVKQQGADAPEGNRQLIATVFFWYSAAIVGVTFGHSALEEWLLSGELQVERERLSSYLGDEALRDTVDSTLRRRKWGFRGLAAAFAALASYGLWVFYLYIQRRYGGLSW